MLVAEGVEEKEATPVSEGNFLFPGYASHPLATAQEPASHLVNEETEAQKRPETCRALVPRPRLNYGALGSQPKSYPCTESLRGSCQGRVWKGLKPGFLGPLVRHAGAALSLKPLKAVW